jgi:gliding motility-associated-like protein
MRKLLGLLALVCILAIDVTAQTYTLNSTLNGTTVTTCSGTFLDNGGGADYSVNRADTVTFCPSTPGKKMRVQFSEIYIGIGDSLVIYDGQNTSAPILGVYDFGNAVGGSIVALNASGCLTFRFKSDALVQDLGWVASLSCAEPCQSFTGGFTTTPAADANGNVNVCLGDFITLNANINYPNNNINYSQSNSTSNFRWRTGFSNDTAGIGLTTITKRVTQFAGYNVKLSVTDANGCNIDTVLKIRVRTSSKPNFKIAQPPSVCMADTSTITSNYELARGSYTIPPFSGKDFFMYDGNGVTFTDTIRITDFAPGQTLTNINQFVGVFMSLEHSYMGDLEIRLEAPNHTFIILKQYPGGAGTFLGEPVDQEGFPDAKGVGYLYGFTPTPTFGTMVSEAGSHSHTFTDALGMVYNNASYLPAGNYTPFQSLNGLIGTSLNGNWVLHIKDNLAIDNGNIFNWRINFVNSIYPAHLQQTYQIPVKSFAWSPAVPSTPATANFLSATDGPSIQVAPTATGWNYYKLRITDSANCFYDTTVRVNINPRPVKPILGDDKIMCSPQNFNLAVQNIAGGHQYVWNTGATGPSITVNQLGTYWVTINNVQGCKNRDTILVKVEPDMLVDLGPDKMFCASATNNLQANVSSNLVSFAWEDGSSSLTKTITAPGLYWLEGTSASGCKTRDSITITDNPINNWQMPTDISTCGSQQLVSITNAPAGTGFTWHDNSTGNDHFFSSSGNYMVTANYQGCNKQDDINIALNPYPTVSLGADTMFCASNPNVLQANTSGTINGYEWNNGSTSSTLNITGTGTYWLEVTSDMGCKTRDSVQVTNNPINTWQTPADVNICGTSHLVILDNYPTGTTFTWDDAATSVTHLFNTSGLYSVTANYIGCLKQDAIDVGIHPLPTINLGIDTMFCASNPNVLQSNITGNVSSLQWNTGATTPTLAITSNGTYWLEATTVNGCKHRDSILITENPINSWQSPADTNICEESTHTIILNNYPAGTNFTWYDGTKQPEHEVNTAGSFAITADYIGCLKQDDITIGLRPLPIVEIGRDTTLCFGFTVPIKASYPGATYEWSNGRTDSFIIANSQNLYWVKATLNGCSYQDSLNVTYVDCSCNTSVPNAFSPNADGINDQLRVHIECLPRKFHFTMFNRYGQPVFETRDLKQAWDGKIKGSNAPVGAYYYILTYFNESLQRDELYKGYVVLVK